MTDDLADRLSGYPDLPPHERTALDARVRAEHPGGLAAHREAQRLAALLDRVRAPEPSPDAVPLDTAAEAAFGDRPLDTVDGDDRAAFEALLPADPRAHFRALDAAAKARDPFVRPLISDASNGDASRSAGPASARAGDRAPAPRARTTRLRWNRTLSLVATLAVLLVGSMAVWRGMQPPLGDFTAAELSLDGYDAVRSGPATGAAAPADARYLDALAHIRAARTTTLGLYPRYDAARLASAQALLEGVATDEAAGDFLRLEAFYALGKLHLLRGDPAAATDALRQVVLGQGAHAAEAEALLRTMYQGATPG